MIVLSRKTNAPLRPLFRYLTPIFLLILSGSPAYAGLQDDLNRNWRGAWVIVNGDVYANCDGSYTKNEVNGRLVAGEGRVILPTGELAKVHKIDLKKARVDVRLDMQEKALISYQDGPFILYREADCQIELMVRMPGGRAKELGIQGIETELDVLLDRYLSVSEAQQSPSWNRRQRKSYPPDYERTLADYRVWKVEAYNQGVQDRIDDAVDRSSRFLASIQNLRTSGDRYREEFANALVYGIILMTENLRGSCEQLLESQPGHYAQRVNVSSRAATDGYNIGQQLAFYVTIASQLQSCYANVPVSSTIPSSSPSQQ